MDKEILRAMLVKEASGRKRNAKYVAAINSGNLPLAETDALRKRVGAYNVAPDYSKALKDWRKVEGTGVGLAEIVEGNRRGGPAVRDALIREERRTRGPGTKYRAAEEALNKARFSAERLKGNATNAMESLGKPRGRYSLFNSMSPDALKDRQPGSGAYIYGGRKAPSKSLRNKWLADEAARSPLNAVDAAAKGRAYERPGLLGKLKSFVKSHPKATIGAGVGALAAGGLATYLATRKKEKTSGVSTEVLRSALHKTITNGAKAEDAGRVYLKNRLAAKEMGHALARSGNVPVERHGMRDFWSVANKPGASRAFNTRMRIASDKVDDAVRAMPEKYDTLGRRFGFEKMLRSMDKTDAPFLARINAR